VLCNYVVGVNVLYLLLLIELLYILTLVLKP
jgi:hypothetical protein